MQSEKLTITNSKGLDLRATLELPPNQKPKRFAIFAHCFTCSSDLGAVRNISRSLATHGFGVVRFDFTGLGSSEGEFHESNFSRNIEDLEDVASYLAEHYQAPSLLVGHSLGGAAVIIASSRISSVKAVATVGAPSEANHVEHLFGHARKELKEKEEVEINIGGRSFTINEAFLKALDAASVKKTLQNLKKPLIVLHSPQDNIVGIENAKEIYDNAFHPKSFISLDGADHLLSNAADSQYVGQVIGSWVDRYLPAISESNIETKGEQVAAKLNVIDDNFTTTISTGKHNFIADEPSKIGGDDFGPNPYELLNAGLAACTVMTLKLYAERKKWPLEEVRVYLSHTKQHAEDIGETGDAKGQIDLIEKKLQIIGDLDQQQIEKLKEIASKCPVHRTLVSPTVIKTELI